MSLQPIVQDITAAADANGKRHAIQARFLCVESNPSRAESYITFGSADGPKVYLRAGLVIAFEACEPAQRDVYLFWTRLELSPAPRDDQKLIRLYWTNDTPIHPAAERIGVYPAPVAEYTRGQFVLDGSAAFALPNVETEEVEITAHPDNAEPFTVGSSAVDGVHDGSGNGDIWPPGCKASFPIDNASRVSVHGAAGLIGSFKIPRTRR